MALSSATPELAPVVQDTSRPPLLSDRSLATRCVRMGEWFYHGNLRLSHELSVGSLQSGDLVEFVILDVSNSERCRALAVVIGQVIEAETGLPLVHVAPVAAENPEVENWLLEHLCSPNGLHFCGKAAASLDTRRAAVFVQLVERWRVVEPRHVTEAWAQRGLERIRSGDAEVENARRVREGSVIPPIRRGLAPALPDSGLLHPQVDSGHLRADPVLAPGTPRPGHEAGLALDSTMAQVANMATELGLRSPTPGRMLDPEEVRHGGGHRGGRSEGTRRSGFDAPVSRAPFPPLPPVRREGATAPPATSEEKAASMVCVAQGFIDHVKALKERHLDPGLSVREKVSARCGRLHLLREGSRCVTKHYKGDDIVMPACEDDEWLRKHEDKDRDRGEGRRGRSQRKRRRRSGGRRRRRGQSSSSASTTRSSGSAQVFRSASHVAQGDSRAAKDAELNAHHVLVESLLETSRTLPRAAGEAACQQAEIFRKLPPVYVAHFRNVLQPALEGGGPSERRNRRELETLSEAMDLILDGEPLKCLMVLLGRRKAVVHASVGGGSWQSAPFLEVLPPPGAALNARDRGNASKDLRDSLKLSQAESGHALPARSVPRGRSQSQRAGDDRRGGRDGDNA